MKAADLEIEAERVLTANPEVVTRYRERKKAMVNHFMGRVMRATKNRANPQAAREIISQMLAEYINQESEPEHRNFI